MISNKDNAVYIENITEQDNEDTDWIIEKNTTIQYKPKEIPLESDTTSTALTTLTEVSENDEVKLIDSGNIVEGKLEAITIGYNSIVSSTDPFGDGSLVAKYELDSTLQATIGDDATITGTEAYITGKFGDGFDATQNRDAVINIPELGNLTPSSNYIISIFIKITEASSGWGSFMSVREKSDILFYDNGTNIVVYSNDGNNQYNTNIAPSIVGDNNFHHIVFCRPGSSACKVYIDKIEHSVDVPTGDTASSGIMLNLNSGDDVQRCIIDQVEIYDRVLTADEIETLYNQQTTKYTVDITSLNLSNAPTKAFFNNDITTTICVEENKNRVINEPLLPLIIDSSTANDGSNLITPVEIYDNEEIIVNDITAKAGTITFDSDTNLYTILLTNHSLTSKPFKAYKKGRIALTKVSSTTTQFVGTSEKNELLQIADIVLLDGEKEVIIRNISETTDDNITTYTIGFDSQSVAPTTCEILSRDTVLQKLTETYDSSNNVFNVTYKDVNLQGRAINRKIQAQKVDTTVVEPLQTELWKKDN